MTDEPKPVAWMYEPHRHGQSPTIFQSRLKYAPGDWTETPLYSGADVAALVEALELIAREGGQAEYRIARQALAKWRTDQP